VTLSSCEYLLARAHTSGATLASPQSDRSSELDRRGAVCVACGLIVWTPRAYCFSRHLRDHPLVWRARRDGAFHMQPKRSVRSRRTLEESFSWVLSFVAI
jgi:hypothetical protein